MENNDYLEHLKGIKGLIEERTKFKALSGLSGVIAGLFALAGAAVGNYVIYHADSVIYTDVRADIYSPDFFKLVLVAVATLVCAITTGLFFSIRNAKRSQTKLWTKAAQKALINFSIPMLMGGIFTIALLWHGYFFLVAPSCLIFYGLALINASNYTFSDVRALGIALLITASLALFLPGRGLLLWAFGFGILHIIYGAVMYFKYEK